MEPGAGQGLHWEYWSTTLVEAGSKASHFLGLLKFRNMKLKKKTKKQKKQHTHKEMVFCSCFGIWGVIYQLGVQLNEVEGRQLPWEFCFLAVCVHPAGKEGRVGGRWGTLTVTSCVFVIRMEPPGTGVVPMAAQ